MSTSDKPTIPTLTDPRSGITVAGPPEFMRTLDEIIEEGRRREREWVAQLQAEGIKAAHPNDGWHDRVRHTIVLCYPYYQYAVGVGDRIALGMPDCYQIFTVSRITDDNIFSVTPPMHYYHYEPESEATP